MQSSMVGGSSLKHFVATDFILAGKSIISSSEYSFMFHTPPSAAGVMFLNGCQQNWANTNIKTD